MIKNIKNLTITDNDFQGTNHKAIALADGSTGAHVSGNRVNPRIGKLITFDDETWRAATSGPARQVIAAKRRCQARSAGDRIQTI